MGEISKANSGIEEYAVYEYPHRAIVPAGTGLVVVVSASAPLTALRCIVDGTIE